MSIHLSLRSIKAGYLNTIINILLIALMVIFLVSVIQIYGYINGLVTEVSSYTQEVIILKPNASLGIDFYMGPIPRNTSAGRPIFNAYKTLLYDKLIYNASFNDEDLINLMNVGGIKNVVRGLTISIYLFNDINVSVESDEKYLYKPPLEIKHLTPTLLAVDARNLSFLADFNDIIEGDFITPYSNEILITEELAHETGLRIGDKIKIFAGGHMYEFKIVGIFSGNNNIFYGGYSIVGDLNYFLKIIEEEYYVFISQYIEDGSWPAYNRLYVQPESAFDVFEAADEIRNTLGVKYRELGVFYHQPNIEVLINALRSLGNRYNTLIYIASFPLVGVLIGLRILDVKNGKKHIALLKAIGWGNKDILVFSLVQTLFIGILGGLLAALILYGLTPFIKDMLILKPSGTGYVNNIVKQMLERVFSSIPNTNFILIAPILGIAIFIAANIGVIAYYIRLEPSNVLKEV